MSAVTNFQRIFALGALFLVSAVLARDTNYGSILQSLYKKASQSHRPLVVVLDPKHTHSDDEDDTNTLLSENDGVRHHHLGDSNIDVENSKLTETIHKLLSKVHNHDRHQVNKNSLKARVNSLKYKDESGSDETRSSKQRSQQRQKSIDKIPKLRSDRDLDSRENHIQTYKKQLEQELYEIENERQQRQRNKRQKLRSQPEDQKSSLRSPLVKGLLRLRNDLRCGAKDDCQDKCADKYSGSKKNNCEDKCEEKYECEPEPPADPCGRGECDLPDECDESEECPMSTRGERLVTEKPRCPRC